MPKVESIAETAHLLRRAGFGASYEELEDYAKIPYEEVVESLLYPDMSPNIDEDVLQRMYGETTIDVYPAKWIYRMINSLHPLEEKIALLWHQVFATAYFKDQAPWANGRQIDNFRNIGLGTLKTILIEISKDPLMISWLDNNENHSDEINENFGRELLELFSMGIGNYTEHDVKECARAFTGWTFTQPVPLYPAGHFLPDFEFLPFDHDYNEKTFLGESGRFNGEDIIDIIVKQQATARFICRHLYNFFVADETQVPAWSEEPPQDPKAIDSLVEAYNSSNGEIRSILRVLFNSGFFKAARYQRVKSPAELVAGTIKLVGTYRFPEPGLVDFADLVTVMGQQLINPPTVEGWHTGKEWIDGGTLNERVNFAVEQVSNIHAPGIRKIIDRLFNESGQLSPEIFVDKTLEYVGSLEVDKKTRNDLILFAQNEGDLDINSAAERHATETRISRMLQLIVSTREYQFA